MLNEFKQYLFGIGKSENTALNYCDKVKLYFKWCLDSFGSEPQQLYRANVLDYISYMKTIKRYNPRGLLFDTVSFKDSAEGVCRGVKKAFQGAHIYITSDNDDDVRTAHRQFFRWKKC